MHNVSQDYKDVVPYSGREWHYRARITLKDGTVLNLGDQDIVQGGVELLSQTSETTRFKYAGIMANQLNLGLNNYDGRYTETYFDSSEIVVYVGLVVEQNWEKGNLVEWVCLGTFIGEKATCNGLVLKIEAFDQTFQFDKPYNLSKLKYPATLRQIVEDACNCCGVVLATHDFPNADYVVDENPVQENLAFRTVLNDAACLAGCFAVFDEYGKLVLKWYDPDADPCTNVEYPDEMWSYDITVTGIRAKNQLTDEEILLGEEGYVISITENLLAQNNLEEALQVIGERVIGFTFRPFQSDIPSNPALEAGDPVLLYDRQGNAHRSYIMLTDYKTGEQTTIGAYSESPTYNDSFTPAAYHYSISAAKTNTEKKINVYDTYAKQFTAMASAAVGYYTTEEPQDDGSVILYAHDKPKLEDSKIIWKKTGLVVAVSNNGLDGPWRGLDKDGNAILNDIAAQTIVANKIVSGRMETQDGRFYLDLDKGESTATKLIGGSLIGDREVEAVIGQKRDDPSAFEGIVLNIDGETRIALNYPIEGLESILPTGLYVTIPSGKQGYIKFEDNQMTIHPPGIAKEGLTTRFDGDVMLTGVSKLRGFLGVPVQVEACEIEKDLTVHGNLHVDGEKTRVVKTSKGMVGVNAYEMAEPYFGDIGESRTNENGQARVDIDPLFAETVNTSCPYQVFVYPYCEGSFYVSERAKDYFVVKGPKNGAFGYEIKARQKGYEEDRLSRVYSGTD